MPWARCLMQQWPLEDPISSRRTGCMKALVESFGFRVTGEDEF